MKRSPALHRLPRRLVLLVSAVAALVVAGLSPVGLGVPTAHATDPAITATPVFRKGVTLAGDENLFIQNDFAKLKDVLNSGAGVIGVNLPWFGATQPCHDCDAVEPATPRNWNDTTYAASESTAKLDKISSFLRTRGNGALLMVIVFGTPGWAACPGDPVDDSPYTPPQDAADFGDFMYAMSERYSGAHTNDDGLELGKVRDWVIYNEVNTPDWWHNSACNTQGLDPVQSYAGSLNRAYDEVHHLPASSDVRVLAGAFTSYHHADEPGTAGTRLSTSYSDWADATDDLQNGIQNHTWISPLDFIQRMHDISARFDAIAHHPYGVRIWDDPILTPPSGAVTLANLDDMLSLLETLYPNDEGKHHLALTEYFVQSFHGDPGAGWDNGPIVPCPNAFCASTTEFNMREWLAVSYGTNGSDKFNVDYLMWGMWQDVSPYTGGLVRGSDFTDKNTGATTSTVRATYSSISP